MRKVHAVLTVAAILAVSAAWEEVAAQKIGYLYSERILQEAPGAQTVKTQLEQESTRLNARLQAMNDTLNKLVEDYQKQSVLLSPDEKKKREDALRARQQQMQQRAQILQEEASNRQNELMGPVMKKVEDIIEVVRKEGGYAIIFDATARVIVSADTTLDVTNQVITRLKASQAGSPPAANR
jgi:outer membrane protein